MAKIKYSDLFEFDGWFRKIDEMEQRSIAFSRASVTALNVTTQAYRDQIAAVKNLVDTLKGVNTRGGGQNSIVAGIGQDLQRAIESAKKYKQIVEDLNRTSRLYEASIAQLRTELASLRAQHAALTPATSNFSQVQQTLVNRTRNVTQAITGQSQAMKLATQALRSADGSYNKLQAETGLLKIRLAQLGGVVDATTGKLTRNNAAAKSLQDQIRRNTEALKAYDAGLGNYQRNVGNYASALGRFRVGIGGVSAAFAGAAIPLLGVATAFEAISKSVDIVDTFSRLKLGLDAVTDSSKKSRESFDFVSQIADKTGVDINALTNSYVSFTAATRNTAVAGEEGDRIFKSFSNSFAALGKSSEVANRGLYAIQQMLSKGKVSSEELNQQLAEALPGANKIFADALGVSTAALADMLKKGDVLSADVLPKVARALEEAYGDKAQRNIQTISGSFTRVTNQFKLFVEYLDRDSAISGFFSKINNGLAELLKTARGATYEMGGLTAEMERVAGVEAKLPELLKKYDELKLKGKDNKDAQKQLFDVIQQIDKLLPGSASGFDKWGNAVDINKEKVSGLVFEMNRLLDVQKKTARESLTAEATNKQAQIDKIQASLKAGTKTVQGGFGTAQYTGQTTEVTYKLSPKEERELRNQLAELSEESVKLRQNIYKVGGKEAFIEDIELVRKLEGKARILQEEYAKTEKIQETFAQSQRRGNKASIQEALRDEIVANKKRLVEATNNAKQLAKIYKDSKGGTVNPTEPITKKGSATNGKEDDDEKNKKEKRKLTEFEKLRAEIEKVRDAIADEFLTDFKEGRDLEISAKTHYTWDVLYEKIEKVSNALGMDVPSDLKKLDGQLNKFRLSVASIEKIKPVKDLKAADEDKNGRPDIYQVKENQLGGAATLLGEQSKEKNQLDQRLDRGTQKKFLEEDKDALRDQLQEIQALQRQAQFANTDTEKKGIEDRIKLAEEEYARKTELAKIHLEERRRIEEAITDLATESVNALFQIGADQNAAEIDANQHRMDHELSLVEGNENAQKIIKEKYAKKDLELRQKQAKMDKAQAAFNIVLNTAVAVSKASPVVPLMVLAAALGAVQLAVVLAKPIPQFWKGTENAPEGYAEVAERGPEIRESKGKRVLYEKPTVAYLNKGDKIYTASETKKLMEQSMKTEELNMITQRSVLSKNGREEVQRNQVIVMQKTNSQPIDYSKMRNAFMDGLDSRPIHQTIIDEDGMRRREKTKNGTTEYRNKRYSLK